MESHESSLRLVAQVSSLLAHLACPKLTLHTLAASLYSEPAERLPLFDILSILVHSSDRDVIGPVSPYYESDSPPPTPQQNHFDRSSRGGEDHAMDSDFGGGNRLPMAGRSNPHAHGVGGDDGDEDEEMAGEGDGFGTSIDDMDMDMDTADDAGESS